MHEMRLRHARLRSCMDAGHKHRMFLPACTNTDHILQSVPRRSCWRASASSSQRETRSAASSSTCAANRTRSACGPRMRPTRPPRSTWASSSRTFWSTTRRSASCRTCAPCACLCGSAFNFSPNAHLLPRKFALEMLQCQASRAAAEHSLVLACAALLQRVAVVVLNQCLRACRTMQSSTTSEQRYSMSLLMSFWLSLSVYAALRHELVLRWQLELLSCRPQDRYTI